MKNLLRKNPILILAIILIGVISIILLLLLTGTTTSRITRQAPTPTPVNRTFPTVQPQADPPAIKELPRINRTINTSSQAVKTSQTEVAKLYPHLPYFNNFTSATGHKMSIVIPGSAFQDDPWKLTVNVFGVEYQMPENNPDYAREKAAFLEAANKIFTWIESNGADPDLVIIKWGDKTVIQSRAVEWLQ